MKTDFPITDFGAVADGKTLCTRSVQNAIDAAHACGGRVIIPAGTFLIGTIVLKSHITLQLQHGSKLLGSPRMEDYCVPLSWGHHNDITPWHLIQATDAEDILITGEGEINGNGNSFWEPTRPSEWSFWRAKLKRVSPMMEFQKCKRLRIENIALKDSAGWTLHLHDCSHSRFEGITIRNTYFGPNTDGIDVTGGHDLIISNCDIATGDDAIALKTSEYSEVCENVVIANCILRTSCVGIRIGYESRQDFRNITVTNCLIPRCSRLFDLRSIEGADIENVVISNIIGSTNSGWPINRPIEIIHCRQPNVYKKWLNPEHHDYGKDKPLTKDSRVRNIVFRDIQIETDGRILVAADDGWCIEDLRFEGIQLDYVLLDDPQPVATGVTGVSLIPGDHAEARGARAAIVAKNVKGFKIRDLSIRWPEYPVPDYWHLLKSPNRLINKVVYEGNEERIRKGELKPVFAPIWTRNVTASQLDIGAIPNSDGSPVKN